MLPLKTMNVSITPELADFVQGRIASGRYRSASEVVRAALRLLEDDERRKQGPALAPHQAEGSHTARPPIAPTAP